MSLDLRRAEVPAEDQPSEESCIFSFEIVSVIPFRFHFEQGYGALINVDSE
jgi:hypothetical protein